MKFTGIFIAIITLLWSILSSLSGEILNKTFQIKTEEGIITFGLFSEHLVFFKSILLITALSFLLIVFLMAIDRNLSKGYTFISILFFPILLSIGLITIILITFSRQMVVESLVPYIVFGVFGLYISTGLFYTSLKALNRYFSVKSSR